jgi:hypothetical protein
MGRLVRGISAGLLLTLTALHAGCGNSASGLTGSLAADSPAITNDDPMARPVQVAWTAARAQRCGFYFDPGRLRDSYISYESRQGAGGEQLAKIQSTYDSTFRTISSNVSGNADYCTDKKSAEIKADLQRHLAGDFSPKLPKTKVASDPCGFWGCTETQSNEPFSSKKLFQDLDKKAGNTSGN